LDYVKARAEHVWNENGFEVVGYQGYEWKYLGFGSTYGGACVWYTIKKTSDDKITYEGCLYRWGDEIHIYNLQAIDAIKPKNKD